MSNLYENLGEFTPDNIFAGSEVPFLVKGIKIGPGKTLKRGTVIAIKTDDNLADIVDSSKSDGLQNPYAILADDVDTTELDPSETENISVYISGYFNSSALTVLESDDIADFELELRKLGIFIR